MTPCVQRHGQYVQCVQYHRYTLLGRPHGPGLYNLLSQTTGEFTPSV